MRVIKPKAEPDTSTLGHGVREPKLQKGTSYGASAQGAFWLRQVNLSG